MAVDTTKPTRPQYGPGPAPPQTPLPPVGGTAGTPTAMPVTVGGHQQPGVTATPVPAQPAAAMNPGVPAQVKPKTGQWVPVAGGGWTEQGGQGYTYNDQGQIYGQNAQGGQDNATYDSGQVLDRAPWMPAPTPGQGGAGGAGGAGGGVPGAMAGYSDPYTGRADAYTGQAGGIYSQGLQTSGDTTEAQTLSQQALRNALGGGADRQKLAMETLRALEDDTEQRSKRNYQDIGRRAAALGGIGQGDVGRQLYEEYGNRERSLANARRDVSLATSDKQLQDLLSKANLGQSASGDLFGRDLQRGQFDLSRGDRLANLGADEFARGSSLRGEARSEDQRGINNRVDQVRLEEELYGNEWGRDRSEIDDLMRYSQGGFDPTDALGDSADYYSDLGGQQGGTAGGLFGQYGRRRENEDYKAFLDQYYGGGARPPAPTQTPPAISGKTPNPQVVPGFQYPGLPRTTQPRV